MSTAIEMTRPSIGADWRMPVVPHVHSFASALDGASSSHSEIADAAAKLVASALVLPAMRSLQDSPMRMKEGPFAPGAAERRFAPLLHAEFADRVTHAANFGLVQSITERFTGRSAGSLEVTA